VVNGLYLNLRMLEEGLILYMDMILENKDFIVLMVAKRLVLYSIKQLIHL